ncbi:putative MFS family arabinose efflux permease [Tamaricihabitans halophyticus]|uniref:Putative MFS family arabinose efflux permease n=1 Tax=Tamaricihabitans halophyticus TaxID=1262583 RepID=A0A4R2Q3U1_9PSEU|nr:MFS transporter [Tamaricihabitans halophyticus]TCP43392.1 putative MFS family arabinose efflux permease [Tamaricihabitans halophyticus]
MSDQIAPDGSAEQDSAGQVRGGFRAYPREIWVLVAASFLIALGYGLVAPALPTFAVSFDVSITAASVVVSAFAFMRLAFAPASGRLVTRFGERPIYLIGILVVGLGSIACAFAVNYWQLLIFRALSGVGSTMFTVSAVGLLIRMAPEHLRGRVSGLWGTSFLLGNIAGPALGGGLVAVSLRAPFLCYGAALLVVTVLVWALLRHSTLAGRQDADTASALTLRAALRNRAYRAAMASNFSNGWTVIGVRVSLIPLFVTAVLQESESSSGIALAIFAVGNVVVLTIAGRLADTWGRKPLVLSGLALLAIGTVLLGQSGTLWFFFVASLVAGAGAGAVNPAQNATVADVLGSKARGGTVLAGYQMAADVGAILGPLLAGVVAEHLSYGAAFTLSAAVAAVAVLVWLPAPETLPAAAKASVR